MDNNFLTTIGHISSIIGIVGAVFSVMIWIKVKRQNKKIFELAERLPLQKDFETMVDYHSDIQTVNPYAFCLSLTDNSESIKQDVENYLKSKGWGKKLKIEELNFNGLTQENFKNFVENLKKKRREFSVKKATEVHIFISGPVQAAAMVGSIFSNWIPVKIYNFAQHAREYEYWCHLSK